MDNNIQFNDIRNFKPDDYLRTPIEGLIENDDYNTYGASYYGSSAYGGTYRRNQIKGYELTKYLPSVYHITGINNRKLLDNVVGAGLIPIIDYVNDLEMQRSIRHATWGLTRWEEELNLSGAGKSTEERRQALLAAIAGKGTTTIKSIENLGYSLLDTTVRVEEDYENFETKIIIVGMKGEPANLPFFIETLREIYPAHIKFSIYTTKMTWDELERYGKTWDEWEALGLTWNEFELYDER